MYFTQNLTTTFGKCAAANGEFLTILQPFCNHDSKSRPFYKLLLLLFNFEQGRDLTAKMVQGLENQVFLAV